MTNEEAAALLDGGVTETVAEPEHSEPGTPKEPASPASPTTGDQGEAKGTEKPDVVKTETKKPEAPEGEGDKAKSDKKEDPKLYSQARASHAFSKLQKRMAKAIRERDEAIAKLKEYEGLSRDNFVDELGKPDEDGWQDARFQKRVLEQRQKDLDESISDMQREADEDEFGRRVDTAFGKDAEAFRAYMNEPVGQQGTPRVKAFENWCNSFDRESAIINRINEDVDGVKLLKHLMEDREDRASLVKAPSARVRNRILDAIQDKLTTSGEAKESKPTETKTASAMEMFRKSRAESKNSPKRVAPTGSAFSGQKDTSGKVTRNNDYFASLL